MLHVAVDDLAQPVLQLLGVGAALACGEGDGEVFAAGVDEGDGGDEILGEKISYGRDEGGRVEMKDEGSRCRE